MDGIHAITLHALVEFLAGVAAFAGVDVCLGQCNFLHNNIRFLCHFGEHPVEQGFRVPVPSRAAGKCEDLDWHSSFLGAGR